MCLEAQSIYIFFFFLSIAAQWIFGLFQGLFIGIFQGSLSTMRTPSSLIFLSVPDLFKLNLYLTGYFERPQRIRHLSQLRLHVFFPLQKEKCARGTCETHCVEGASFFITNDDSRISRRGDEIKGSSLPHAKSASLRLRFLPPAFNRASA